MAPFIPAAVGSGADSFTVRFGKEALHQLGWFITTAGSLIVGLALNEAVKMSIDYGIPPDKVKKTLGIKWGYFAGAFVFFVIIVTLFSLAVQDVAHATVN